MWQVIILTVAATLAIVVGAIALGLTVWSRLYRPFEPDVYYNEPGNLTEVILKDCLTVWQPWGPYKGHAVDLGYDENDRLVGIRIWDNVRTRKLKTSADIDAEESTSARVKRLQREIGDRQTELAALVLGDPRKVVSMTTEPVPPWPLMSNQVSKDVDPAPSRSN